MRAQFLTSIYSHSHSPAENMAKEMSSLLKNVLKPLMMAVELQWCILICILKKKAATTSQVSFLTNALLLPCSKSEYFTGSPRWDMRNVFFLPLLVWISAKVVFSFKKIPVKAAQILLLLRSESWWSFSWLWGGRGGEVFQEQVSSQSWRNDSFGHLLLKVGQRVSDTGVVLKMTEDIFLNQTPHPDLLLRSSSAL